MFEAANVSVMLAIKCLGCDSTFSRSMNRLLSLKLYCDVLVVVDVLRDCGHTY